MPRPDGHALRPGRVAAVVVIAAGHLGLLVLLTGRTVKPPMHEAPALVLRLLDTAPVPQAAVALPSWPFPAVAIPTVMLPEPRLPPESITPPSVLPHAESGPPSCAPPPAPQSDPLPCLSLPGGFHLQAHALAALQARFDPAATRPKPAWETDRMPVIPTERWQKAEQWWGKLYDGR